MPSPLDISRLVLEVIFLYLKINWYIIQAIYRTFFPKSLQSVTNKIVLITGAGQGLGKELALQYGKKGATVVCLDINETSNNKTVSELKEQGIKAHAYACNVSNKKEVDEVAKKVQKEVGTVNILVNNAGVLTCKALLDHSEIEIRRIIEVNVVSQFWTLQAFLSAMVAKKSGHIVCISSASGLQGVANATAYSTSKFAVRGLMNAVAEECRQNGWGIKFTTVCPFFVDTGMCQNPKTRFESILGILSPQHAAASVIKAQQQCRKEVTVPGFIGKCFFILSPLPEEAQNDILDFVQTGIDVDS